MSMIVLCCTKRESEKGEVIIQIHEHIGECHTCSPSPSPSPFHDGKLELCKCDTGQGSEGLTGVTGRSQKKVGCQQNKSQRPG